VEDVRPQAIGRELRVLGEHERLVEECDCLTDLGLRVAQDADLEDDARAIDVGEASAERERRRLLEERHRRLELPSSNARPRLAAAEA
jgi:hypothetical protein